MTERFIVGRMSVQSLCGSIPLWSLRANPRSFGTPGPGPSEWCGSSQTLYIASRILRHRVNA